MKQIQIQKQKPRRRRELPPIAGLPPRRPQQTDKTRAVLRSIERELRKHP